MIYNAKDTLLLVFSLLTAVYFSVCSANDVQTMDESRRVKFEQVFAEQCVRKETRNSVNKEDDKRRFSEPCSCIAKRIAADLAIPDIEKFMDENKSTHSLRMSFDEAAFFCVQQKKIPKSPALFGRK